MTDTDSDTDTTMPSMRTLAPLVNQLQAIARAELPAPRTCRVRLYDDHTYRITIEHHHPDSTEAIVYDRVTGAVSRRDTAGARQLVLHDPAFHDTVITTAFAADAEDVITTIEPPLACEPDTMPCDEIGDTASCPLCCTLADLTLD